MKKYLALLLSILCIFALCACGTEVAPDPTESVEPTESAEPTESVEPVEPVESEDPDDPDDGNTDEKQPISDPLSLEALSEELGVDLIIPEGVEAVLFKDGETVQITFKLDGKEYCFRAKKTETAQNVSGVELKNPEVDDSNEEFTMYLSGSSGLVTWFFDGVSFSVYMESGADFDELLIIHDMLIP